MLLRGEDDDVPGLKLPFRQFQHHLGAKGRVQPEVDGGTAGKFLFQQFAVHPEGHTAAPHQHNAGSRCLFQQVALVSQLAQETLVILSRQAKAANQQNQGAQQQQGHNLKPQFLFHSVPPSELEVDEGIAGPLGQQ